MIHFFPTFSKNAEKPFGEELRNIGVSFRIFGGFVRFHFRSRIMIVLVGYPKLIWFSLQAAIKSMVISRPHPDAVVLGSDVEILLFSFVRMFLLCKKPSVIFLGFIYTTSHSSLLLILRRFYYSVVLYNCTRVICHSKLELERYARIFPRSARHFVFVPWGGNVNGWREVNLEDTDDHRGHPFRVLSIGRSGRDYPTLARAVAGEPFDVTVICDYRESLSGLKDAVNLRVLRNCYGKHYLDELRRCDAVVVPLAVEDISAGQMVIIQAMAYGKPIIVTRTPTVEDYMTDGAEGLMVRRGDADDLRQAIRHLSTDHTLYSRLRKVARSAYEERYSQATYMRNVVKAVEDTYCRR